MTRYLTLAEFFVLAGHATRIDPMELARASRVELAESALHAPAAGFGSHEFYPDMWMKSAVLCYRICRNHPLPDGNKRSAWLAMRVFIALNNGRWRPESTSVDDAEAMMVGVAAGEVTELALAKWLRDRVDFN